MAKYADAGTVVSWRAGAQRAMPPHVIRSLASQLLHAELIFDIHILSSGRVTRLGSAPNMKREAGGTSRRPAYRPLVKRVHSKGARS
jgi:hypothetical protein